MDLVRNQCLVKDQTIKCGKVEVSKAFLLRGQFSSSGRQENKLRKCLFCYEKELEETDQKITDTTEEVVKQSETITKDEGEQVEEKKDLATVERRELRQKCAVMFPAVFTQFTKQKSQHASGMCPCQGSATGVSMVSLAIDAAEEADKVVQSLFLKKLALEARFLMQV